MQSLHGVRRGDYHTHSGLMSDDDDDQEGLEEEGRHNVRTVSNLLNSSSNGDADEECEDEDFDYREEEMGVGALVNFPVRTDVRALAVKCLYCTQKFSGILII